MVPGCRRPEEEEGTQGRYHGRGEPSHTAGLIVPSCQTRCRSLAAKLDTFPGTCVQCKRSAASHCLPVHRAIRHFLSVVSAHGVHCCRLPHSLRSKKNSRKSLEKSTQSQLGKSYHCRTLRAAILLPALVPGWLSHGQHTRIIPCFQSETHGCIVCFEPTGQVIPNPKRRKEGVPHRPLQRPRKRLKQKPLPQLAFQPKARSSSLKAPPRAW